MELIFFYGVPPEHADCTEVDPPDGLSTTTDQRLLHPVVQTGMVPHGLNRPASAVAVARQLGVHFGDTLPIRVGVPGYGVFRIGTEGWCVE
ncbi:MAG: hypothetical protein M0R06_04655 [Sphaerochaeta sp.]|jgi:hypothetical protein|nr:hypothetical protein [Sphaerochaeta sp.]